MPLERRELPTGILATACNRARGSACQRFAPLSGLSMRSPGRTTSTAALGLALAAMLAVGPSRLTAQQLQAFALQEDNGQLDFWLPPVRRPDTELTNSAALLLDFDGAPLWRRLYPSVPSCVAAAPAQRCSTTEFRLGQDIYTPASSIRSPDPLPGQRPYAGWLYLSGTGRVASPTVSDAVTLEVGVTGAPSLAAQIQTAWHALIRYPQALGWSHQIPFQPGILVSAEHQREMLRATVDGIPVVSLVPDVSVSLGNVLTGASAGAEAHVGYGVTTPWSVGVRSPSTPLEVYGLAALHEDLVIAEMFLDEPTTQPDLRVEKLPFVTQYEVGAGLRIHAVRIEYRGVTRTREYVTGPPQRAYGVLTAGMRFGW